jgi:hypothetical protein
MAGTGDACNVAAHNVPPGGRPFVDLDRRAALI